VFEIGSAGFDLRSDKSACGKTLLVDELQVAVDTDIAGIGLAPYLLAVCRIALNGGNAAPFFA
jgi:hypothetical protein